MMTNLRSLFLLLLLGTASAALALGIRNDLRRPPEVPAAAGIDAAASGQTLNIPEMPKYDPPPIERFAATLDRPLFSADRRPPEGQPIATGIGDNRALTATLQGVLFASSGSIALLTAVGESTPMPVSLGEVFLGWRLLEIHPDNVVFGRDEETVTLELIYKAEAAPPQRTRAQRTRSPRRPQQRTRSPRTPQQPAPQQPAPQQPAPQQPAPQQPAPQQPAPQQPAPQQPAPQQPAPQQPTILRQ